MNEAELIPQRALPTTVVPSFTLASLVVYSETERVLFPFIDHLFKRRFRQGKHFGQIYTRLFQFLTRFHKTSLILAPLSRTSEERVLLFLNSYFSSVNAEISLMLSPTIAKSIALFIDPTFSWSSIAIFLTPLRFGFVDKWTSA